MTTRIIQSARDRADVIRLIESYAMPFTVSVRKGKDRSIEQNNLQFKWVGEAAKQLADETAEEKRAYCKLHFGVPILRAENDDFRAAYDRVIRPKSYEDKIMLMMAPLDMPVSSLMTTGQMTRYLDAVYQHFRGLGVILTEPKSG